MLRIAALLCALVLAPAPRAPAADILWQKKWEDALATAKAEKRAIFVAVNMDGERANDHLASAVYKDAAILALAQSTVNVVASVAEHASGDHPCTRFAGLTCQDHRRMDAALRKAVLKPDAGGWVVAPQHVFLDPDGKVLLSVPYEVTVGELAWCFVTALHQVDAASKVALPDGARAPRRLIQGGVYDPANAPGGGQRTPTRAEVVELIKNLRKSARGNWEIAELRPILASDEPEALDFIRTELRSGGGGGGGGGKGGKGGGAGGAAANGGQALHAQLLHAMGIFSPTAYWEIAAEYTTDGDLKVRDEAIVALEQLAAPDSLKALNAALAKAKDAKIEKDILRALGSAGANDKGVRAELVRRAKSERDPLLRVNAIVAAGALSMGDDLAAVLEDLLAKGSSDERTAAACAMALSRDKRFAKALEPAAKDARDAAASKAAELALAVVRGGPLAKIRPALRAVCQDGIERERFFGAPTP